MFLPKNIIDQVFAFLRISPTASAMKIGEAIDSLSAPEMDRFEKLLDWENVRDYADPPTKAIYIKESYKEMLNRPEDANIYIWPGDKI